MNQDFSPIGKWLVMVGAALLAIGLLLLWWPQGGKLPGDLVVRRKNLTFYFPLMTSLIISLLLSLLWYAFKKFR